ncbi:hypothetical protein JOC34_001141 [Virgibacillus halotolerans]|nr:hypothetical protein [Virgibacillus halotolerans]
MYITKELSDLQLFTIEEAILLIDWFTTGTAL